MELRIGLCIPEKYALVRAEGNERGLLREARSVQLLTAESKGDLLLLQKLHVLGRTEGSWHK